MHHIKLAGSYEQMGYKQGRLLKRSGFTLPPPEKRMLRFAKQCEEVVGQYMPELLDEIHGVAEGAEIDYDAIMTLTTTAPFDPAVRHLQERIATASTLRILKPDMIVFVRCSVARS